MGQSGNNTIRQSGNEIWSVIIITLRAGVSFVCKSLRTRSDF